MLTNLKVSLLLCERVFYRPEHSGKEGNAEIKYTNG